MCVEITANEKTTSISKNSLLEFRIAQSSPQRAETLRVGTREGRADIFKDSKTSP